MMLGQLALVQHSYASLLLFHRPRSSQSFSSVLTSIHWPTSPWTFQPTWRLSGSSSSSPLPILHRRRARLHHHEGGRRQTVSGLFLSDPPAHPHALGVQVVSHNQHMFGCTFLRVVHEPNAVDKRHGVSQRGLVQPDAQGHVLSLVFEKPRGMVRHVLRHRARDDVAVASQGEGGIDLPLELRELLPLSPLVGPLPQDDVADNRRVHQGVHRGHLFAEVRVQILRQLRDADQGVVVTFDKPFGMGKVFCCPTIAVFYLGR
mmetsp:Transcript_5750/g.12152  ORF Transcript_5750/g.12152 Transcript_5750/m.12152 type:complete len:260 (+) Transcript_5750:158-937(+)